MRRRIGLAGAVAGLVALAWLAWPDPPADRAPAPDAPATASTRAPEPSAQGPARRFGPAPRSGPRARPSAGPAEPTGQMILNVVGPHGALVDDVRIGVQVFLSLGVWDRGGTATRRQDGAWVVVRESLRDRVALVRDPAERTVFVQSPRLGGIVVPFEDGATIDVRFQDPVRLAVRFEGIPETFASNILAAVPPRSHDGRPAR